MRRNIEHGVYDAVRRSDRYAQPTTQELFMIDPRVIAPNTNRADNFIEEAFTVITLAMTGLISLLVFTVI
jgi:hypothetical protein